MELLQNLVNGVVLGCMYAGFALGLSLVFGVLGILNVAHSAVLILAALVYFEFVNGLGVDVVLAIAPVLLIFLAFGMALHRQFVQRLEREQHTTVLLVFFGLMVVVESVAVMVWTTDTRNVSTDYLAGTVRAGGLSVPTGRLVAALLVLGLFLAVYLFLTRTLTGAAIRGMAQNRDVAEMVGIPVSRLATYVFGAGIALAAFGGVVLGMTLPFSPQAHVRWLAWAFLIVIIGGLGSVAYTLLAGIALGLVETLAGSVLPFQYTYLIIYGLLAVALLIRSEGLRGTAVRTL